MTNHSISNGTYLGADFSPSTLTSKYTVLDISGSGFLTSIHGNNANIRVEIDGHKCIPNSDSNVGTTLQDTPLILRFKSSLKVYTQTTGGVRVRYMLD